MTTWILLRGLTRERRHWGEFPAMLKEKMPSATVVAPDLPGTGALNGMRSAGSIEGMLEQYRGQLSNLGVAPPYFVVALSMGAMVTLAWCERHPEELAGCVLINTSLRSFSPFYRRLRPSRYAGLLRALLSKDAATCERAILEATSNRRRADAALLKEWTDWRRERPVSTGNTLRQLTAAMRYRPALGKPQVPALVLASRNDRLVAAACSERIADEWQWPIAIHPTAGHDLPLDDPAWVVERIELWVRETANAAAEE